jgi:hypothetical protein
LALPFWVPDWSLHTHFSGPDFIDDELVDKPGLSFSACGNTRAEANIGGMGLSVKGIHVDTIWKTLPISQWDVWKSLDLTSGEESTQRVIKISYKQFRLWEKMIGVDKFPDRAYPGGGTLIEAHCRTLMADVVRPHSDKPTRRLTTEDIEQYRKFRANFEAEQQQLGDQKHEFIFDYDTRNKTKIFPSDIANSIARIQADHHMFITTKGYFGVGDQQVYAGDFVCVLFGGKQPFVLRSGQTYVTSEGYPFTPLSFFGAAYVHGIMDGEAMKDVNESNTLEFIIQ